MFDQPVRSSIYRLVKERADNSDDTAAEAFKFVRAEMNDGNEEILARYQELVDERMKAVAEVIFQVSDLKMDACDKIVRALVKTGYLSD